jgi:four helix bundle protein
MGDFKKLLVWQRAHTCALAIYRATQGFPGTEVYGVTRQIRRAALSIPSSIAEGSAKQGDKEFRRFLRIARGSASETEYQLLFARDLGYLSAAQWTELSAAINEIGRMLTGLIESLESSAHGAQSPNRQKRTRN